MSGNNNDENALEKHSSINLDWTTADGYYGITSCKVDPTNDIMEISGFNAWLPDAVLEKLPVKELKCECGSWAVGSNKHANYCALKLLE